MAALIVSSQATDAAAAGTFRVWVFSDAHVATDKANGRESLTAAFQQSESATGFD
jgi:hypothetical protein